MADVIDLSSRKTLQKDAAVLPDTEQVLNLSPRQRRTLTILQSMSNLVLEGRLSEVTGVGLDETTGYPLYFASFDEETEDGSRHQMIGCLETLKSGIVNDTIHEPFLNLKGEILKQEVEE